MGPRPQQAAPPRGGRTGHRPGPDGHRGALHCGDGRREPGARAGSRRGAAAARPGAVQLQRLHQLPRLQPAGRRGPRPEPDRRRRRRGVLPGLQRAHAAGAPGGAGHAEADAADLRPGHRRGSGQPGRPRRLRPGQRRRPDPAGGKRGGASRRRPGPRWRAVPSQLLLVPQLHRSRRCAVVGQVRPEPGPGERDADLHGDAVRPAEHAQVLRPAAHAGGEGGHHRLHHVRPGRQQQLRRQPARRHRPGVRGPHGVPRRPDGHGRLRDLAGGQDMTTTRHDGTGPARPDDAEHGPSLGAEGGHRAPDVSAEDLEGMSQPQLARLASALDDVEVVHNQDPWPVRGTRAEKRAARSVALWFLISAISGLAFLLAFLFWPYEYVPPGAPGYFVHSLYTPVVGGTLGFCILAMGIAVIAYVKKFFPDEVSVQQRHDGPSDEVARRTVVAQVVQAGKETGIGRRKMIAGSAGAAVGVLGLGLGIAAVAPLVRNPWKGGDEAALWTTGWRPINGETVYLRYDTGDPKEIALVRPEDQEP